MSVLILLFPLPKNVRNSVNPGSTWQQTLAWLIFFPPKLTESHGYLFIYLLMIYILSSSKKDLSASLDVLALAPKSVSISRKKLAAGGVVFGFTPESMELPEKAYNEPITAENE